MIEIVLLGAPRGKERVKRAGFGAAHSYLPERTVTFEGRMAKAASDAMGERPPLEGPIRLDIVMRFPVPASKPKRWKDAALRGEIRPLVKPDWDNGGKLTDALNLIVWVDDKQVVEATVKKFYSEKPGMFIRVEPITNKEIEGIFG